MIRSMPMWWKGIFMYLLLGHFFFLFLPWPCIYTDEEPVARGEEQGTGIRQLESARQRRAIHSLSVFRIRFSKSPRICSTHVVELTTAMHRALR